MEDLLEKTKIKNLTSTVALYADATTPSLQKPYMLAFSYIDIKNIPVVVFLYIGSKRIYVSTKENNYVKEYPNYQFHGKYKFLKLLEKHEALAIVKSYESDVVLRTSGFNWYRHTRECPTTIKNIMKKYQN